MLEIKSKKILINSVEKLTLDEGRHYTSEIVKILYYLRHVHIAHRDVKPGNLLRNLDNELILIDFSSAKVINEESFRLLVEESKSQSSDSSFTKTRKSTNTSFVGTEEYVSPEMLFGKPTSFEADLWALGVIIYQFFAGCTPFKGKTTFFTFGNIMNVNYTFPYDFPDEARDIVDKLL